MIHVNGRNTLYYVLHKDDFLNLFFFVVSFIDILKIGPYLLVPPFPFMGGVTTIVVSLGAWKETRSSHRNYVKVSQNSILLQYLVVNRPCLQSPRMARYLSIDLFHVFGNDPMLLSIMPFFFSGLCFRLWCIWEAWYWWDGQRCHANRYIILCQSRNPGEESCRPLWRETLVGCYDARRALCLGRRGWWKTRTWSHKVL